MYERAASRLIGGWSLVNFRAAVIFSCCGSKQPTKAPIQLFVEGVRKKMTIFTKHSYTFPLSEKRVWLRLLRKYHPRPKTSWQIRDDHETGTCHVTTPRLDAFEACRVALREARPFTIHSAEFDLNLAAAKKSDLVALLQLTRTLRQLRNDRTDRGFSAVFSKRANVKWLLINMENRDFVEGCFYSEKDDSVLLLLKGKGRRCLRLDSEGFRDAALPILDMDDGFVQDKLAMPEWQALFQKWKAAFHSDPEKNWNNPIL